MSTTAFAIALLKKAATTAAEKHGILLVLGSGFLGVGFVALPIGLLYVVSFIEAPIPHTIALVYAVAVTFVLFILIVILTLRALLGSRSRARSSPPRRSAVGRKSPMGSQKP